MISTRSGKLPCATLLNIFALSSVVVVVSVLSILSRRRKRSVIDPKFVPRRTTEMHPAGHRNTTRGGYEALIGNTPLVRLDRLSFLTKREIYVKMESLNPGGTGKDRVALSMLQRAEEAGLLPRPLETMEKLISGKRCRRGIVVEGTSGSTGIALAALCASRGHDLVIVMPDDQAVEKQTLLRCYGADVYVVPNCSISNPNHYVNVARRIARDLVHEQGKKAAFMDQFENDANYDAHYRFTGPEIWSQTCGKVNAFVMSSGTGGTISGVGKYLKKQNSAVKVVLVDPPGSALYNKVKHGVAFAFEQRERFMRRHRYDTIVEGIGLDRVTRNFSLGVDNNVIDDAIRVSDQDAVDMAHWLLQEEGIFVGSSTAVNIVGAVNVARSMKQGSVVVTIVCDGGQRHMTRFWNRDFIIESDLQWPGDTGKNLRQPSCLDDAGSSIS